MKGGFKQTPISIGFTIIEVMIFLAVSGVTFLIAAVFINGKEAQTEFTQGMTKANAEIVNIIDNVSNGNYPVPSGSNLNCTFSMGGFTFSSGPALPWCSFIGQVLDPDSADPGHIGQYAVYSVAGCQFYDPNAATCATNVAQVPQNIHQENPQVAPITDYNSWPNGLQFDNLYLCSSNPCIAASRTTLGAIGFFDSLPNSVNGNLQSGAETVQVYQLVSPFNPGLITGLTSSDAINNSTNNDYVLMCFSYGGRKGSITIGTSGGGQQTTTNLQLEQAVNSGC